MHEAERSPLALVAFLVTRVDVVWASSESKLLTEAQKCLET